MATHHRAVTAGHGARTAALGLTLTVVVIGAVLAIRAGTAVEETAYDIGFLVAAAVLAGAGLVAKRLCGSRSRTAERRAYHRRFSHTPTIDTPPTTIDVIDLRTTEDRERTSH